MDDVTTFLARLDHPHKPEIEALRAIILGVDPRVVEGIKWNAPSFRTSEWFATFHLRAKGGVQLILHRGAKARGGDWEVPDPTGLLQWHAPDRASAKFTDTADVAAKRAALEEILRVWVARL